MTNWKKVLEEKGAFWCYGGVGPHVKTSMSGKYVDAYFNSDVITQEPQLISEIIKSTLLPELSDNIDYIVGYAPYSIPIAFEAAKLLGAKFAYTLPSEKYVTTFSIPDGSTALVVADDMYGGGAALATIQELESKGIKVVDLVYCLANMTGQETLNRRRILSAASMKTSKYSPDECVLCRNGSEALLPRTNWNDLRND